MLHLQWFVYIFGKLTIFVTFFLTIFGKFTFFYLNIIRIKVIVANIYILEIMSVYSKKLVNFNNFISSK